MTRFYEACDRCYSEMICECPECEDKDRLIEQLLDACRYTLNSLNGMTSDEFCNGADKECRLVLETAIKEAEDD